MKKLFIKIFMLFISLIIVLYVFSVFYKWKGIEPILTNSVSFDAKILYLREQKIDNIDLIALGSSMTLNNVNSDVIVSAIGKHSYFNFSSWALKIADIEYLIKFIVPKYKPKCILLTSSVIDFENHIIPVDIPRYFEISMFLSRKFDLYFYIKNPQYGELIDRNNEIERFRSITDKYQKLTFDKYGGISLNVPKQNIEASRWEINFSPPQENQFEALNNLAKLASDYNIKLVFVQVPIKKDYYRKPEDQKILISYFERTKNIVTSNNQVYLNFHDEEIFKDSLFCDVFHLNSSASEYFTNLIVEKINLDSLIISK
jgi:hypothetical protein